ncbi:MAG: helix-turn-helix domain-containing protein [Bacteriovoracia bacterium]
MDSRFDPNEILTLIKDFLDNYERPQEIFTEEEAAKYLRVPLQTLKNYTKKKKISWCLVGKQKIYTREQLNEFLKRKVRLHRYW